MTEPDLHKEIEALRAEADRLRLERDRYREETFSKHQDSEESTSAQLRLLAAALRKENQEEFFGWLGKIATIGGIVALVATLGGALTVSDLISQRIQGAVEEREADISKLRDDVIQAVVDFKIQANTALNQIRSATSEVTSESERAREEIAARSRSVPEGTVATSGQEQGVITIPVVVHIVYRSESGNVTDAQVHSQLAVLNADFRARNSDISKVPGPFKPLIGDAKIQFVLAAIDSKGLPSTGITRTKTTRQGFSAGDEIKASRTGGADPWPTEHFLNVWVGELSGGLLGYSQFPGGPAETDGVVISTQAFGTMGTAQAPFNKGRTTTSQIARYLNVRHIWGDTPDCTGDDFVADTPVQAGPNHGTPKFPHSSCNNGPHGDLFMNFADYVDDEAMVMFTLGQVARMRETLEKSRRRLWQR